VSIGVAQPDDVMTVRPRGLRQLQAFCVDPQHRQSHGPFHSLVKLVNCRQA
jgi:hypothetical protein